MSRTQALARYCQTSAGPSRRIKFAGPRRSEILWPASPKSCSGSSLIADLGNGVAAVCGVGFGFTVTAGILRCAASAGFGATLCWAGSGSAGGSLGVARQPASVVKRKTETKCLTLFSLFFARSAGQDVCDLGVGDRFHVAFDAAATVHFEFSVADAALDAAFGVNH